MQVHERQRRSPTANETYNSKPGGVRPKSAFGAMRKVPHTLQPRIDTPLATMFRREPDLTPHCY